jgi:glycosyltransferase involved in cell wall biosynthesis
MSSGNECEVPEILVVIPVFRNEESLVELYHRISQVFYEQNYRWRIVFVDDASPDNSLMVLRGLAERENNVTVLSLKKNVGQHRAVLTGLWYCQGNCKYAVVMDGDLQDPPEAIPEMIEILERGYDAVFAGRRGKYESSIRHLTSRLFRYARRVINRVPKDAGMFVVLSRKMVERIGSIFTHLPSVVALIGWTGLPVISVPVTRSERKYGCSAFNGRERLKMAAIGLLGGICWRCFLFRNRSTARPKIGRVLHVFGRNQGLRSTGDWR